MQQMQRMALFRWPAVVAAAAVAGLRLVVHRAQDGATARQYSTVVGGKPARRGPVGWRLRERFQGAGPLKIRAAATLVGAPFRRIYSALK